MVASFPPPSRSAVTTTTTTTTASIHWLITAMASVTVRPSLDNPESNVNIDKANEIIQRLQSAKLYTSTLQSNFEQKVAEFGGSDPKSAISARRHPAEIAGDVAAQVVCLRLSCLVSISDMPTKSFLRTLKFQYLEQNAKDKYIKTIVDDEAPLITIDDNESLRETNEQRKAELKAAKEKLAAKYGNIKSLASEVEESRCRLVDFKNDTHIATEHRLANTLATSLASLTSQILDARLALSRLRNQHPPPRLSLATAEATLEAQTDAMASLDHALANMNDKLEDTKNELGEKAREVERLKMERAAVEKELEEGERGRDGGEEDGRVVGLYDWYVYILHKYAFLY